MKCNFKRIYKLFLYIKTTSRIKHIWRILLKSLENMTENFNFIDEQFHSFEHFHWLEITCILLLFKRFYLLMFHLLPKCKLPICFIMQGVWRLVVSVNLESCQRKKFPHADINQYQPKKYDGEHLYHGTIIHSREASGSQTTCTFMSVLCIL